MNKISIIRLILSETTPMERRFVSDMNGKWRKEYQTFVMETETVIKSKVDALTVTLPNASVNKDYKTSLSIPIKDIRIEEVHIKGHTAEEMGLTYSISDANNTVEISGSPLMSGEFELEISYRYKDQPEDRSSLSRVLPLIINPDPRSLWKDIPVEDNIKYPKADEDKQYVKVQACEDGTPRKDIVAASKRGRSHANEGKPRDDDFKVDYIKETGWYIIAVADGAGSAQYSREGSKIACETVMKHCREMLLEPKNFEDNILCYQEFRNESKDEEAGRKFVGDDIYSILVNAAFKAHREINKEAKQTGNQPKDYATTLLVSICKKFDEEWFVATFWVGDGAICIYNADNHKSILMGTPDEGEFAGQTRFLTMPEIFKDAKSLYERLRFYFVPDFTALFLMTDGVSDPKFETDANLQKVECWDALWKDLKENGVQLSDDNEESAGQLLNWLDFWSPGNHDDRTIAILY